MKRNAHDIVDKLHNDGKKMRTSTDSVDKVANPHIYEDLKFLSDDNMTSKSIPIALSNFAKMLKRWMVERREILLQQFTMLRDAQKREDTRIYIERAIDILCSELSQDTLGDPESQIKLATLFRQIHTDYNVVSYDRVGVRWLLIACGSGHADAYLTLALICKKKLYDWMSNEPIIAAKLIKIAAEKNYDKGLFNYATILYTGDGLPKDKKEAIKIVKRCADEFSMPEAQHRYAYYLRDGDTIVNNKPSEILKYLRRAKNQGYLPSKYLLANMYYIGDVFTMNRTKAARLYKELSESTPTSNFSEKLRLKSQYYYASMLLDGSNIPGDEKEGLRLMLDCSNRSYAAAQFLIAVYTYEGTHGIPQNKMEAYMLYERAASNGCLYALYELGMMRETGDTVEKDVVKAFYFYKTAFDKGSPITKKLRYMLSRNLETENAYCD